MSTIVDSNPNLTAVLRWLVDCNAAAGMSDNISDGDVPTDVLQSLLDRGNALYVDPVAHPDAFGEFRDQLWEIRDELAMREHDGPDVRPDPTDAGYLARQAQMRREWNEYLVSVAVKFSTFPLDEV